MKKLIEQTRAKGGVVYLTSDLHLGHNNILKFGRDKWFKTIEEHDKAIIDVLKKAERKDLIIVLGDVAFGGVENLRLLKQVKAKMVLVKGNHDNRTDNVYLQYFERVEEEPVMLTNRIIATHHPIPLIDGYLWNVHGHLHEQFLATSNNLNVNIDNWSRLYDMQFLEELIEKDKTKRAFHQREGNAWYREKVLNCGEE